ncbi:GNAT family N-acetyltransferase [Thermococcus sp.]
MDELVVSGEHRGEGIGRKLIEAAVELCRELGCVEVEVSTEIGNLKAREFYRSMGFEETAVLLEMNLE